MNEVITIDDLCAGFEQAALEDEMVKNGEKLNAFASALQTAFQNAYIFYKANINLNARSPQTKTFKDFLVKNKNLRNDLPQPYMEWCRGGFQMHFNEESKEIYFRVNIREAYINIPRLEIKSRTWTFHDLDGPLPQTGAENVSR